MSNAIEIRNLTKYYGKHRGVDNISLAVEEGDMFGFLGPNGAGKSTSIRCLLGLLHFSEGEIEVLGHTVRAGKTGEEQTAAATKPETGAARLKILQNTGYMPSEAMFYPSMRVSEVIRLAAKVRGIDCSKEAAKLCESLKVDTQKRISELSLGNRKKVSIVCALQHNPKLLILDEPTSGLDPLMQEVFFSLLEERNKQGVTCFLSSHVLPEVRQFCKHAGIIRDGKLIRVDSVENLTKSNLRKIKVKGITKLPDIAGISGISVGTEEISFSYTGEVRPLLIALGELPISDILVEEPSLEEIFMHFYEEGGKEDGSVMA
ncbi:MAG: ABC transporter ATP-binding protein [Lachnospiraceae bacterium]